MTIGLQWVDTVFHLAIALAYAWTVWMLRPLRYQNWQAAGTAMRQLLQALRLFLIACGVRYCLDRFNLSEWGAIVVDGLTAAIGIKTAITTSLACSAVDRTLNEKQHLEQNLRCTELTLTAFADNSSVVMAIKSLDGVHHWVNNTFCHVFGNVEGCPVVDWMPPYAIEVTTEHDLEVWESQVPMRFLESIPTPDGIRRVWDVRKFPLMFDPGFETADRRFIGIVAIEVTSQIESTQQISEYARRLEKANASLNQFAYIVSHDLRAPLRSIEGFLVRFRNAVVTHADLTEQETLYLDTVLGATHWMQRLIEDLTLFNQTMRTEKTPVFVDLRLLLDRVLERLNSVIVDRAAIIDDASFPEVGIALVWGDEVNLGLVLQNVIDNATKFVPSDRTPRVQVSARKRPGGWTIEVADNGIGIEERFFGKIFQLFQRLHDRESFEGTGVGLAIAKEIVDAHGGTLTVVSAPEAGSTFQISLHSCASSSSYSAAR